MKKLLLMCCVLLGVSAASYAQGGGGRGPRTPEDQLKQLQTQVKLTDDQSAKALEIYKAAAVRTDSLTKAANGDRDAMRAGRRPIMEATNAKIKAILKPDQVTTFDSIQKVRMARMQNGGGGGGGGQN